MNHSVLFTNIGTLTPTRSPGPYRIAHFLREHEWDVEVIDYLQYWTLDELKKLTKTRVHTDTKFFGFSFMFYAKNLFPINFLAWLREEYPHIKIIVGGPNIWPYNHEYIDYLVGGYGEYALLELLRYLFGNGQRPQFLLRGGVKTIDATKAYPAYPMQSYMIKYQDRDFLHSYEWLGIEIARGCRFKCAFCNFPVLGVKEDHSRTADDFREQIQDAYDRFGISKYIVADETFNDRTDKVTKFADVVESVNFKPLFAGYLRADLLIRRPEEMAELLRMNFVSHFYGVETFHHEAGKAIGKGMHPDEMKAGLVQIKNYFKQNGSGKYRGTLGLIIGLPHEPVESIAQTKKWLLENWQGESYNPAALKIGTRGVSGVFNPASKMFEDYEKYGYREIENNGYAGIYKDDFLWANEHMTIFDAIDLYEDLEDMHSDPANNFTMRAMQGSRICDDSFFELHANDAARDMGHIQSAVHAYKQNKLNLNVTYVSHKQTAEVV